MSLSNFIVLVAGKIRRYSNQSLFQLTSEKSRNIVMIRAHMHYKPPKYAYKYAL